jgi:YaiO family outer membrane protein
VRSLPACLVAILTCWCLSVGVAVAQDDVIERARAAAADGRRAEGLAILETHLKSSQNDVDARLVYGLILSWDGKYDEARTALNQVLAQTPDYLDARVALMNVEWWSGRTREAREHVNAVLARDAGNTQARLVLQRLDARTRPWSAGLSYTMDSFDDGRESWGETSLTLGRETPVGSLTLRANQAQRFGLDDRQVDIEFYPTFRAGTYAFVGVGLGTDELLYPKNRLSVDLYQSIGRGFEISGGYRQLNFSETTQIYLATLTKYSGNWMLTAKTFVVPDRVAGDAWSYHAVVRRYFGSSGTSYIGGGYSHGFSKEEPRGEGDLIRVDADTVRGQADIEITSRARIAFSVSTSRQERAVFATLWQTTASGGFTLRF